MPNARPGLESYFKTRQPLRSINTIYIYLISILNNGFKIMFIHYLCSLE
jgi:hypothetical protein